MTWQGVLDDITETLLSIYLKDGPKYRDDKFVHERIILAILNAPEVVKTLNSWLDEKEKIDRDICRKDYEKGEDCRKKGNQFYVAGINVKALELYNDSIRYYPENVDDVGEGNGLALAFANRSAIFFSQKEYFKCLSDIEKAFKFRYPENLKHKLFKRKAECLIAVRKIKEAIVALRYAKENLCNQKLSIKDRERHASTIDSLLGKVIDFDINEKKNALKDHEGGDLKSRHENYKKLENASDGVKLRYNTTNGRYLIAKKNFKPGDVLIEEKPFASVIFHKFRKTHCWHCFQKADDILPCPNCCLPSYCSEKCQKGSMKENHFIECHHLVELQEVGISSLALRVLLKTSVEELCSEHFKLLHKADNETWQYGLQGENYSSEYEAVYNLTTHIKEMNFSDIVQYEVVATVLLLMLRRANFFERPEINESKDRIKKEYGVLCQQILTDGTFKKYESIDLIELLYGSLLCKHIHQIICNGMAITGIYDIKDSKELKVVKYEQTRFGTGIFPTVSLMNHSCDPNCIQTFIGDAVIIKVTKEVKPGQELTISYGPLFNKNKFQERQRDLKEHYFFTCACDKCKDSPSEETEFVDFKCQYCSGPIPIKDSAACPSCKRTFDKEWYTNLCEKLSSMSDISIKTNPEDAIKMLKKSLKIQETIFYQYHRSLASTRSTLAQALAELQEYSEAKDHFKKALEILKIINGDESVEVGHALLTYSDLLMGHLQDNMLRCSKTGERPDFECAKECLQVIRMALKILRSMTSMTSESEQLIDLKEKEKHLTEFLNWQ